MKRALAIFAKTPLPGRVKTRLTPPLSPRNAAALYRCMLLDTIARSSTLDIDIVIFYEGGRQFFLDAAPGARLVHQHEGGLGTRLERAFGALSEMGYEARVVIGTDAPDLPLAYIDEAFRLMESGSDAVFGPAADGGYYLVALKGEYGELFRDVPWSTGQVLATSLERARTSSLSVSLLPPWYDVDSFEDLSRPGLSDPLNGAPLTRGYIGDFGIGTSPAVDAGRSRR